MVGAMPSRLLDAMLSRAVASRTEKCCTPSRPGGIVLAPPLADPPNVLLAPPSDTAAATPALAPMNRRRLSLLLIPSLASSAHSELSPRRGNAVDLCPTGDRTERTVL